LETDMLQSISFIPNIKTMRQFILFLTLSFPLNLKAQEIFRVPDGASSSISSFENPNGKKGAGGQTNKTAKGNAFERLKAGESKTLLDISGTGIIQRMWFTVRDRDPKTLRSMRFRILWDGDVKPAVDVPFGDFFLANLGRTVTFQSALFSSPEGRSYNCIIPMPFRKGAKVVITNEGDSLQGLLFYDIDYVLLPSLPADAQYFHAYWTRQRSNLLKQDFEVLPKVKGKGRFLGMSVGVNVDKAYENTWWGEGEVKMYLDGDSKYPTINGTGTEDYVGTGWGLSAYSNWYQGCHLADKETKQYDFYRWHLPDAIYFMKDIRVVLQEIGGGDFQEVRELYQKGIPLDPISVDGRDGFARLYELPVTPKITDADFPKGWVNFYRVDDYTSVSYFYLNRTSSELPVLPPVKDRILSLR